VAAEVKGTDGIIDQAHTVAVVAAVLVPVLVMKHQMNIRDQFITMETMELGAWMILPRSSRRWPASALDFLHRRHRPLDINKNSPTEAQMIAIYCKEPIL